MKLAAKIMVICTIMIYPLLCAHAEGGGYLVKFKAGYYPPLAEYALKEINAARGIYSAENEDAWTGLESYIEYTSVNRSVSLIEGRETVSLLSLPDDDLYPEQWQLQMVNADSAWKLEAYGNDIIVGVIDSGCYAHDDLKNNLLDGKNYLTGSSNVTDNHGHGTHVSGIIAAEANGTGTVGVAPKAKIVPLKCFDIGVDTFISDIVGAIYDAADVYKCRIINMSWGVGYDEPILKEAIDYADSKGVILIAAVGNYGSSTLYYPAAYDNVIGVTSVGQEKGKSSFAQYNKSVTIAAPGENAKSTYKNGNYEELCGTSQAAPVISGIAAAALSIDETLTSADFRQLLTETAEDLGAAGYDVKFGYGLADENALINKLMQNIPYYVSPVNLTDSGAYVLIKNNTGDILHSSSLFSEYENGKFIKCTEKQITLLQNKELIIKTDSSGCDISHFLWDGMKSAKPLSAAKETHPRHSG